MSTSLPRIWVAQKVQLPQSRLGELWVMVAGTLHPPRYLNMKADEEKDMGPEADSEDDKDFDEE